MCRLIDFPVVASGQLPQPFWEWLGEANDQMLSVNFRRLWDVFGPFKRMSSREFRRPPDVTCGAAILDLRWRRRKWRQPGLGVLFSIPIEAVAQNGDPSASGRHLGWPHFRFRKWGHRRWRPEAEGSPFCASASIGIEKSTLYYSQIRHWTFKRHPIPRPHGRAMGCLLWGFARKFTAL